MNKAGASRTINFVLIITGGLMALVTKTEDPYGQYIIILGAVLLMIGLYRVSRNIPNSQPQKQNESEPILDDDFDDSVDLKDDNSKE